MRITPGSSAEKAGLQVGDKVESTDRLSPSSGNSAPQQRYRVYRNGQRFEVTVTMENLVPVKPGG